MPDNSGPSPASTENADAAIGELIEQTAVEACEAWEAWSGATVERRPELTIMRSDVNFPMFNGVFGGVFADGNSADAGIAEVMQDGRTRQAGLMWWLGPRSRPQDLSRRLIARGWINAGTNTGMACTADEVVPPASPPAGWTITRALDDETLDVFGSLAGPLFDFPEFAVGPWTELHRATAAAEGDRWSHWLARLDGEPAGAASLYLGSQAATIAGVGVLPPFRRRGIAAATTHHLLQQASQAGYRQFVLFSSPMALNVYRGLGFRPYCEGACLMWSPDGPPDTSFTA